VDWDRGACLQDPDALIGALAAAFDARIDGEADPDEPVGLLTHHLVHGEAHWSFCAQLFERLRKHENLRYLPPRLLFR
jgi:hypothetical protein